MVRTSAEADELEKWIVAEAEFFGNFAAAET